MSFPNLDIYLIAGEETTFNIISLYPPQYNQTYNTEWTYEIDWFIGKVFWQTNININYAHFTISQSQNINTLNFPLNYYPLINNPSLLINGTDFLKEIKLKVDVPGTFYLKFWYFGDDPSVVYDLDLGTWKVTVVQPPPTPSFENANINYNKYDRSLRLEKNINKQISCGLDGLYPNGEKIKVTSTLPAWFLNTTVDNYSSYFTIQPPSTGVFTYNLEIYTTVKIFNGTSWVYDYPRLLGVATLTIIVVDSLFEEIDNCCSDDNVNIVWLNRQGGRGNFIFSQRRDYNVEVGKKNTYITNDIKKYAEIKNVYNGMKVYATGLTLNQIDFLDTLRYSIQAWMFKNNNFIPILLDVDSFEKYNTKENMYEISLSFIFAEQLNIQRQ